MRMYRYTLMAHLLIIALLPPAGAGLNLNHVCLQQPCAASEKGPKTDAAANFRAWPNLPSLPAGGSAAKRVAADASSCSQSASTNR